MADAPDTATEDEVAVEATPEPETMHGALMTRQAGVVVLHPSRDDLVAVVGALRDDGWLMCLDVTAVDYLSHQRKDLPEAVQPERFEVVVTLISHHERARLRLRVQVPETDPTVPTLFELHPGIEAAEREVFDMFGISFSGHPDLTRILMPEDWVGHPLRKDFGIGAIPVQFKAAPSSR